MCRVIVTYPPVYKTPIKIEKVDGQEELFDLMDEVEQQFGKCTVIHDHEWKEFVKLINEEEYYER